MEDPKPSSSEPAGELFDRWLSHHEGASGGTRAPVGPVTPDAALEAEQVALAVRLAEEAREAHLAAAPTAPAAPTTPTALTAPTAPTPPSSVDVQQAPATPAAAADERLTWSSGSPLSRLAARLRPAPTAPDAAEDSSPPRFTLVASSAPSPPPAPAEAPTTPPGTTRAASRTSPSGEATTSGTTGHDNGTVVFKPRTGARRVVGVLLLASLAATAYAGYEAYDVRTTNTIAVAATLGTLSLVLWALRAGSSAPRLRVTSGQLEVLGSAGRFVFDLDSPYTPIEVVGTAGRRGWKVLFLRRGMSPFVVDSSMVDPVEFMTVLRRHRPEPTD